MDATETRDQSQDLNQAMASMVKLISEIGPKIPEIARRMGRHKETVRYWYKKLQEHEFAITAIVNHEALGLKRLVMKVKFGDAYEEYVVPLMAAMSQLCYINGYSKALPEDIYVMSASVPADYTAEYVDFIEALRQEGVFKSVEYYMLDWVRNQSMRADSYDFASGHWDLDFKALSQDLDSVKPALDSPISPRVKFDKIDLLIAKELQRDATRELNEVQRSIKEIDGVDINYKTLCWHLSQHVEPRLLKGYKINWMGTRYDIKTQRGYTKQHSYLGVDVFARGIRMDERMEVLAKVGRLPILWMEGAGSDYYAQVAIPTELTVEGLQYLQSAMKTVGDRTSFLIADQRNAAAYTLAYNLYDEDVKAWKFNREELLVKFRALQAQISNN